MNHLLTPNPNDQVLAANSANAISSVLGETLRAELSLTVGQEIRVVPIPLSILESLGQLMLHLSEGNAVTIAPVHMELTTQQAADILGVSRPYLVQLLEEGKIPFRKPHSHRRVRLLDVLEYKAKEEKARHEALDELAQLSQEMGFYDE